MLPEWVELVAPPRVLFSGGPVSQHGAVCVAKVADPIEEPPGWRRVIGDIGLLHLDTPVELAAGGYTALRIYAGYSGWAPGQLEAELAQGLWYRMDSREEDIFTADPSGLWRRVLRRHGGTPALLSTWPPTHSSTDPPSEPAIPLTAVTDRRGEHERIFSRLPIAT